jgi:hypothetical protein
MEPPVVLVSAAIMHPSCIEKIEIKMAKDCTYLENTAANSCSGLGKLRLILWLVIDESFVPETVVVVKASLRDLVHIR